MKVLISHNNKVGYFQYQQMGRGYERQMKQHMAHLSEQIQRDGFTAKKGNMSDGSEYVRHILGRQVNTLLIVDEKKAKMMFA